MPPAAVTQVVLPNCVGAPERCSARFRAWASRSLRRSVWR